MKKFLFFFFIVSILGSSMPNLVYAKTPNDPKGKSHWSFKDIGAYEAWDITTGSKDVVVAIIDNGFDATHPDLKDNVWKNVDEIEGNNIDDDKNGYIDDVWGWNFVQTDLNGDKKLRGDELLGNNNPVPEVDGLTAKEKEDGFFNHGTLVAGIIGAVGNNKKDMAGLNWNIRLMNVKVLSNSGAGDYTPLVRALDYAIDNGADIINISAVGTDSKDLKNTINRAYEKGIVVVAAAGNNGNSLKTSPLYPACSDAGSKVQKVLGVSAIDEAHRLATFSNYGSNCVDITAPGVNMGSLLRYAPEEGLRTSYSDGWNGTSFSTPLVSGAAALIKAVQPEWKAPQIYEALLKNTHKTPPKDEASYKDMFGAGLLQVDKAVLYAKEMGSSARVLGGLGLFDAASGSLVQVDSKKQITTSSQAFLRKVTTFKAFKNGNDLNYLTVRPFQGNEQFTLYSSSWKKLYRFDLSKVKIGEVFAGNFGQGGTQILVTPPTDSDPFVLLSLDGKKQKEAYLDVPGTLLVSNVFSGLSAASSEIAVVSKEQNKYFLQTFDGGLVKKETLALPSLGRITSVERGDIDADGTAEYIVLSQKGVNATVSIVDKKGKLIRQFPVSSNVEAQDVDLVLGDFTGDKKEDIITLEKNASKILVWKNSGEIIQSVVFPQKQDQIFSLIPLY